MSGRSLRKRARKNATEGETKKTKKTPVSRVTEETIALDSDLDDSLAEKEFQRAIEASIQDQVKNRLKDLASDDEDFNIPNFISSPQLYVITPDEAAPSTSRCLHITITSPEKEVQVCDQESENKQAIEHEELQKNIQEVLKEANEILGQLQEDKKPVEAAPETKEPKESKCCPICLTSLDSGQHLAVTPCGHLFCNLCIRNALQHNKKCPTCRRSVAVKKLYSVFL